MLLPSHCDNICGATKFLLLALLLVFQIDSNAAERSCNVCEGDDCNQIGHERKEICNNGQQVCATVFDGESILAKGCLNTIPENLRMKCQGSDVDILNQCHKCNDDDCNEWIPSAFFCVQCDSKTDPTCTIQDDIIYKDPTRCNLNRVPNILCYALKKGDRIKRGCATTLEEQKTCLTSDGCYFCNPSIMPGCNSLIPFLEDSDEQTTESPTHQPTKPPPQPPVTHKPNTGAAIGASASSYIVIATALFWKYLW
ncbi:uncharacterized protein LOC142238429 [Haematobia irritans]|uniref:uncharacterized protein LOC142238429 n=1 Tax=Haematobia irritans TaxID=7368 RepID=UPI003F503241